MAANTACFRLVLGWSVRVRDQFCFAWANSTINYIIYPLSLKICFVSC